MYSTCSGVANGILTGLRLNFLIINEVFTIKNIVLLNVVANFRPKALDENPPNDQKAD